MTERHQKIYRKNMKTNFLNAADVMFADLKPFNSINYANSGGITGSTTNFTTTGTLTVGNYSPSYYTGGDLPVESYTLAEFHTLDSKVKYPHPIDIIGDKEKGIIIDVACTGLTKDDVEVLIEGDILNIRYNKPQLEIKDQKIEEIHRGITRKSFNLAWKISSKLNLDKLEAKMENGLLNIVIPFTEESKPKTVKIK